MALVSGQTKSRSATPGRTVGRRRLPAEWSPAGLFFIGGRLAWPASWGDMIFGVLLVSALAVMFGLGFVMLSESLNHFPSHTLTLPDRE